MVLLVEEEQPDLHLLLLPVLVELLLGVLVLAAGVGPEQDVELVDLALQWFTVDLEVEHALEQGVLQFGPVEFGHLQVGQQARGLLRQQHFYRDQAGHLVLFDGLFPGEQTDFVAQLFHL